jgi:hypothetical protein
VRGEGGELMWPKLGREVAAGGFYLEYDERRRSQLLRASKNFVLVVCANSAG